MRSRTGSGGATRRRYLGTLTAGAAGLAATSLGVLAGCAPGAASGPDAGTGRPSSGPAVSLRFMTRGSDGYKAWFEQMAALFHQRQPRVDVGVEHVTGSPSYHEKLITQQAAGDPPDTVFTTNDYMFEEAAKGMLLDLTPSFNKSRIKKGDYYAAALEPQFLRNKLFAMPVDYGVWALWYNVEMLKRAGVPPPTDKWTWDDYRRYGQKLTLDRNGRSADQPGFDPTQVVQYGAERNFEYAWKIITEGNGAPWVTKELDRCLLDSPGCSDAFQQIVDMDARHHFVVSRLQPVAGTWRFRDANLAMKVGGSWEISNLRDKQWEWDVAPVPTGKTKWWTIGEASGISTPKGAKHPDESWDLNLLMTGPEGQASGFPAGVTTVPALPKVAEEQFAAAPKPAGLKSLLAVLPKAGFPYYQEVISGQTIADEIFAKELTPLWTTEKTPREVLPRVAQLVTDVLKKDNDLKV
jgi:multiple sugar transport system substrate-binding protein